MSDAKTILDAGVRLAGPTTLDNGAAFVVVPADHELHSLEEYLDHPIRARQKVSVEDVESFVAYFNRFKKTESVIFARQGIVGSRNYMVNGVLDYHRPDSEKVSGEAGHVGHSITYSPPFSEEWTRWKTKNGHRLSQTDFALFMEENSLDIVEPKAADMIEVSRSLRAKKNVEFVSDQCLADGSVQFTFYEDVKGTAGKGNMKVPEKFTIGVPVFFNGAAYKVAAHLRYRIDGGKLVVWYDLHRAEYVEQAAFKEIVEKILKGTGAPLFRGGLA